MKIVYVVDSFMNAGGTERVLSIKANYLVNKGYDISIITPETSTHEPFFQFDENISFFSLDILDKEKNKSLYLLKLTELLLEIKPDISISTGLGLSVYLSEAKDQSKKIFEYHFSKYKRKYWFATLDDFYLGRLFSNFYTRKKIKLAKSYDKFIVLTEEDKTSWRDIPNIEVIPNPISFVPKELSNNKNKRVIIIGRFTYQKRIDEIVDIWREIQVLHPDWKLAIYGDGRKRKLITDKVSKYKLDDVITIYSPTKNVEKELVNSSIYVMTSRYEGHPLVLLEAMVCGLPVVSYACKCGPRDIIKDGEDGYIIKMNDISDFVEKLSQLMSDENLRQAMGIKASQNIQRFSEENILPLWDQLFKRMVDSNE